MATSAPTELSLIKSSSAREVLLNALDTVKLEESSCPLSPFSRGTAFNRNCSRRWKIPW